MKKRIFIAILLSISSEVFADELKIDFGKEIKNLSEKVRILQSENRKQKNDLKIINSKLITEQNKINIIKTQVKLNNTELNKIDKSLDLKILSAETNANKKINIVDESLSIKTLYGIIGLFSIILISCISYWAIRKKQQSDKSDIIEQLSNTKSSIEESLVKEFCKHTESMELLLKIIDEQKNIVENTSIEVPNHSLALKVSNEINLIERNIRLMDHKTKGLKQLYASAGKLKDNLSANGYEMPELLGKQFHQGMKVIVTNSILDDNLEKGSEIISKVLIPQVNYNNKTIQTAQIEVSVGS